MLSSLSDGGLDAAGAEEELGDLLHGRQRPVRNRVGAAVIAVLVDVVLVVTGVVLVRRRGLVVALVSLVGVVVLAAGQRRCGRVAVFAPALCGHWLVDVVARRMRAVVGLGPCRVGVMGGEVFRHDVVLLVPVR